MWRGISNNFCRGFCHMAWAGVIDVLEKHNAICYINMKLNFMFICILSVNTKMIYTVYQNILWYAFYHVKRKCTVLNWTASTIDCVLCLSWICSIPMASSSPRHLLYINILYRLCHFHTYIHTDQDCDAVFVGSFHMYNVLIQWAPWQVW